MKRFFTTTDGVLDLLTTFGIAIAVLVTGWLVGAVVTAKVKEQNADIWCGVGHVVYVKSINVTGVVNRLRIYGDITNVNILAVGTNGTPVKIDDINVRLLGEVKQLEN